MGINVYFLTKNYMPNHANIVAGKIVAISPSSMVAVNLWCLPAYKQTAPYCFLRTVWLVLNSTTPFSK